MLNSCCRPSIRRWGSFWSVGMGRSIGDSWVVVKGGLIRGSVGMDGIVGDSGGRGKGILRGESVGVGF